MFYLEKLNYYIKILFLSAFFVLMSLTLNMIVGNIFIAHAKETSASSANKWIKIEGNKVLSDKMVISYLELKQTKRKPTKNEISKSLKALYKSEKFSDVSADDKGDFWLITLEENFLIQDVFFEVDGDNVFEKLELTNFLAIHPGQHLHKNTLWMAIKMLVEKYKERGYYAVHIEPRIVKSGSVKTDLIIKITEGPKSYVGGIVFVGNEGITDRELKASIITQEKTWYNFFSATDYNKDLLAYDLYNLSMLYANNGFPYVNFHTPVVRFSPEQKGAFISIFVEENGRYKIGDIDFKFLSYDLKEETKEKIKSKISDLIRAEGKFREGRRKEDIGYFSLGILKESLVFIKSAFRSLGYTFVNADFHYKRSETQENHVDISFVITREDSKYIDDINISGNVITYDSVIRKSMKTISGDPFVGDETLKKVKQEIYSTGFFSNVDVQVKELGEGMVTLDIEVEERETGQISGNMQYSLETGLVFAFKHSESNFMGTGSSVDINVGKKLYGGLDLSFSLSKQGLGSYDDLYWGGGLYYNSRIDNPFFKYDVTQSGFSFNLGQLLRYNFTYRFGYRFAYTNTFNVAKVLKDLVPEKVMPFSFPSHTIDYDTRDSRTRPSRGFHAFLRQELGIGIWGNDSLFLKNTIVANKYIKLNNPLVDKDIVVFNIGAMLGYMFNLNRQGMLIPENQLFHETMRGFQPNGVGPAALGINKTGHIVATPLGSLGYIKGVGQFTFAPPAISKIADLRLLFFSEAGTFFGTEDEGKHVYKGGHLLLSAGVGVIWGSPFGDLLVTMAYPIRKSKFSKTKIFEMGFSNIF